jgi:hypothetical protein
MSTEENKASVRRVYEEVLNRGDLAVVDELFTTDYEPHSRPGLQFRGPAGFKGFAMMLRTAYQGE